MFDQIYNFYPDKMTKAFVAPAVYSSGTVHFKINDLEPRSEPLKVLLCHPQYFDIVDVKNAYMEGQQGLLDKNLALAQWEKLKSIYLGLKEEGVVEEVLEIPGAVGCEDMVFCANQTFPWNTGAEKIVVMSKMRHESRRREVPFFETYFAANGYSPVHLKNATMFEGMGDTIPHPQLKLLYGGYGHRSDTAAYEELANLLQVPVITLELIHPNFYHLDTCFVPLSSTEVMLCKEAFTAEGMKVIGNMFSKIYEIPISEAITTFCLNAHVIHNANNGKKAAIIQKGSTVALKALTETGYTIYETETSEFMKSGGSVFCMKMMCY